MPVTNGNGWAKQILATVLGAGILGGITSWGVAQSKWEKVAQLEQTAHETKEALERSRQREQEIRERVVKIETKTENIERKVDEQREVLDRIEQNTSGRRR